ncbi:MULTISPECIES: DUF502 domain-containing protein [Sphingobacterium]|jgi:uncharacterized membrane protein|uniref:DUF502 domain-containing protein n=2 Tax=Sphingobacterium TaxID=28453 RepID=A0ABW5YYR0_9SPHI|nr:MULTISPECIES: DUF502 domain-containing protein [Sphingobacterium]MBB2952223.1 putative membrane protein [Sphingobacterium sp. JUb56]MCS3553765.1 putative membrane protein [Sphingobacterium sp. JUb21]MCW2260670.1 putative membrane protein [Sphingobacterium kitahiroshimense]NJI75785.1 DUF502 domain-containing protein [Sphingobacterium sp. B16(2022)]QQD13916.1 DUF502 domain-containing protein [Sphingobacterium sp. UDSM-2020]
MLSKLIRAFLNYLIKGTLVVVPLAGAVFLIVWIVASVDSALNLTGLFLEDETGHPLYIPGIGILTVILFLVVAGIVFTNFVTDPIKHWLNNQINRIPLLNTLYSSIKDFTEAFVGDAKKFNVPVLVKVNEIGVSKIGFLTQSDLSKIKLTDEVVVYFPYSYSFAGQVVVVKSSLVTKLDMSATDAMKLVVSGGVSGLE